MTGDGNWLASGHPITPASGEGPVPPPSDGSGFSDGDPPASQATPTRPDTHIIRPMPTSSQGPDFEAIAMQSVLSRARDSTRFVPPPPAQQEQPRAPFPLRAFVLVIVVTLVVGAALGVVWVRFLRPAATTDDDTIVRPTTTSDEVVGSSTAASVVEDYLGALARGDVEEAMKYGPGTNLGSRILLTNEAYARMPQESRPGNIEILTTDPGATEIQVRYMLAGSPVETGYRVVRRDDDTWQLAQGSITATWQIAGGANVPLFINGVEVDHSQPIQLVPGTYQLGTGQEFIAFPDSSTITIQSLAYSEDPLFPVTPELTEAGRSAFLASARSSLTRCLARQELAPEGCPNGVRTSLPVDASTIRWRLVGDPWDNFNASLWAEDQSVATATVSLRMEVEMTYANGNYAGTTPVNTNSRLRANMLGSDPESVSIRWER